MDLQCATLEFGSTTQGIGHLVRFSLHVYEFEPVALHFLDPASLTMGQVGRRDSEADT